MLHSTKAVEFIGQSDSGSKIDIQSIVTQTRQSQHAGYSILDWIYAVHTCSKFVKKEFIWTKMIPNRQLAVVWLQNKTKFNENYKQPTRPTIYIIYKYTLLV